jgi:hypothetical protein
MLNLNDPKTIARRLKEAFAEEAFAVVGLRAEDARQAGDQEGVSFWNEVARRLVTHQSKRRVEPQDLVGRSLWWLMQKVEYYRHHASAAEGKAAAASGQLREDMNYVARSWRELALHADLLAQVSAELPCEGSSRPAPADRSARSPAHSTQFSR